MADKNEYDFREDEENNGNGGQSGKSMLWLRLLLVLAVFGIVIGVLYFKFIMKDPWINTSDTEQTYASPTPVPPPTPTPEPTPVPSPTPGPTYDPGITPAPGFSSQIARTKLAERADVIFLVTQGEETSLCNFHVFEKQGGAWPQIISTEGCVGTNGINTGRRKQDDLTTPRGIFRARSAFGILQAPGGTRLQYKVVDDDDYWDGDINSPTYNDMVKGSEMPESWDRAASEHLADYAGPYNYCIDIGFNKNPTVPGDGFAIFLHCRRPGTDHTGGCISVPEDIMVRCLQMATDNSYFVILDRNSSLHEMDAEFG